jgi:hypothetical protein
LKLKLFVCQYDVLCVDVSENVSVGVWGIKNVWGGLWLCLCVGVDALFLPFSEIFRNHHTLTGLEGLFVCNFCCKENILKISIASRLLIYHSLHQMHPVYIL